MKRQKIQDDIRRQKRERAKAKQREKILNQNKPDWSHPESGI